MIRRLNPMSDKNRIAAAKQINDSRVRHFSRATDFSNAFQNVRRFRRRELCKYSPGGDDILMPIFAGLKFKANALGASEGASIGNVRNFSAIDSAASSAVDGGAPVLGFEISCEQDANALSATMKGNEIAARILRLHVGRRKGH
jgi:hypothetical protein